MKRVKYIDNDPELKGRTALALASNRPGWIKVQFDDLSLPEDITHGWSEYQTELFEEIPSEETCQS